MFVQAGGFEYTVSSSKGCGGGSSAETENDLCFGSMKLLQIAMDERQKVLCQAGANHTHENGDDGRNTSNSGTIGPLPNLGQSVKPPWERATTAANVPYYIE